MDMLPSVAIPTSYVLRSAIATTAELFLSRFNSYNSIIMLACFTGSH